MAKKTKLGGPPRENPFDEARRYMENAREILSEKGGKDGRAYSDKKYVRMAGNTAWNGCLIALDATLKVSKSMKKDQRPDIKDYEEAIAKIDRNANSKMLRPTYEAIHLYLGYDGNLLYSIVSPAMKAGDYLIDWCEKHYKP